MTVSSSIAPHLPYLRRFARAVSGAQTSGDAYALATLEAIVADTHALRKDLEPRVALYQVFLRVWGSVAFSAGDRVDEENRLQPAKPASAGLQRLEALTPRSRVAFVLSAIEGFSTEQIAQALGCKAKEAEDLLHNAAVEISHQIATDVLIVEDEPIIAMDIEALVESLGHRVTEVARTHAEALAAVRRRRPGLILADVQLADGSSGINAVHEILELVPGSGNFHHRLSRAPADGRASRAHLPDFKAFPSRDGQSRDKSGLVLRSKSLGAAQNCEERRLICASSTRVYSVAAEERVLDQ